MSAPLPTLYEWAGGSEAFGGPPLEWGTRLASVNSQPGAHPPAQAPVPHWGWGEAPPYTP